MEALAFGRALQAGQLPKIPIVSFLRSLSIVHAVLERALSQVSSGPIAALVKQVSPKVPLLSADFETLAAAELPSITPALHIAIDYGVELLAEAQDPLSLIGPLYVLEGSQNGAAALKRSYAYCLNITAERLTYIGCYGDATAAHWQEFSELMDSLALSAEQIERIVASAIYCFEQIERICTALYPYSDSDLRYHVAAINFEAGDHAIPQNPREIELALRAGQMAWRRYPYLELRFGERGKRFTSSDSCWLVALTRMPVEIATKSLLWLRRVLASRGIPTIILEAHLRVISAALAAELPEDIGMRTRYDQFLSGLDGERRGAERSETLPHLIADFDERFQTCSGLRVNSAAQLIASAWMDERAGIAGSLASVRDWFTDTERFSEDWITTVNELLTKLGAAGGSPC